MRFVEFEEIMSSNGCNTLAEIARALESTPQAVSNWKSRDQVPHHVVNKILENNENLAPNPSQKIYQNFNLENDVISFSDILVTMAEQIKLILFVPFIFVFISFTYMQFIQKPVYTSWSTMLIPSNQQSGAISGLASQFGVNLNSNNQQADLSSPVLLPEILNSRTFAEKLLKRKFYSTELDKETYLINILNDEKDKIQDTGFSNSRAISKLDKMINFEQNLNTGISTVYVETHEPKFSMDLALAVLEQLEESNRFYKSQSTYEKTAFIEDRIKSVEKELIFSEKNLKKFNEQNRQISSPALQLQLERLNRDVEVQKGIYLTLKQQLELAKIEIIQKASILQVLDRPQIPISPSNVNLKLGLAIAIFIGLIVGIALGFFRSFLNSGNISERKKIRRMRGFLKNKSKEIIYDIRISSSIFTIMLLASPLYFGHRSVNPTFFGMYSLKFFLVNLFYLSLMIFFLFAIIKTLKSTSVKNEQY